MTSNMSEINVIKQVITHWDLGDVAITPIESHSHTTWDVDGLTCRKYR